MKLSNGRIVNSSAKLAELSEKFLPVKASYAIAKNMAKLDLIVKIYTVERNKLIEKCGVKDTNGKTIVSDGVVTMQPELVDEWVKGSNELLAIENEIEIHKFSIAALDGYNMSAAEFMLIDYMIIDEE